MEKAPHGRRNKYRERQEDKSIRIEGEGRDVGEEREQKRETRDKGEKVKAKKG